MANVSKIAITTPPFCCLSQKKYKTQYEKMKDKYTPVPDTPVLIRAKRAYLNASDVSTPGTLPLLLFLGFFMEKTGKRSVGNKHAKQRISQCGS